MITRLFSKPTLTDLLTELEKDSFNESEAESIINSIDLFHKDDHNRTFLHKIANRNNIESILWLVNKGIDVNTIDKNGNTALMIAARNNAYSAVEKLISLKANANIKNKEGKLALHEAASNNGVLSFNHLKEVTDNLNDVDNENKSILSYIIDLNNVDLLNSFLDDKRLIIDESILFCDDIYKSSDMFMTFVKKKFDFNIFDEDKKTALFYMVRNGLYDVEIFDTLLSQGINLNHVDDFGNNALFELIQTIIIYKDSANKELKENLYKLIPLFMEEGINTTIYNKEGETLLSLAVKNKNNKLVTALLQNEIDPNILNDKKRSALYTAAMIGQDVIDIIFLLLDYGADSNIKDYKNKTIIEKLIDSILLINNKKRIIISERKHIDETQDYYLILEEILANSEANLKILNTNNQPYFFEALKYGNLRVVKLLMKHGSDINQPADDGLNIIYHYLRENVTFRREIDKNVYYTNLKTIISVGADVNSRDDFGGITLHKAILDNDDKTIKILLNSGADINAIDNRGRNIVHNTIWKNKIKQFRLILSYNKKLINAPDKFGVLPINYAAFLGYHEMVVELIDTESQVNNPYKKTKYILNFLERFHKNLLPLIQETRTTTNKQKVASLIKNMIKEFEIKLTDQEKKELARI